MPENRCKKILFRFVIVLIIIIILILLPFIISLTSSYSALVTNNDSKYFMVKNMLTIGDYFFCMKDSREYNKRKEALANNEHDYSFIFMSMPDIANIEVIPGEDESEPVVSGTADIKYFGKYKVDVSGNIGFLYLSMKKGKVYGSLRFPDWGNGAFERLKSIWINKGKIGFIRSVETIEELRRVGSPAYFTQEFHGEYKDGGNVIQGYYLNRGAHMMWRAFKLKK